MLLSCQQESQTKIIDLLSPNEKIKFQLTSENGKSFLQYSILWNDTILISKSIIAFDLEGEEFDQLSIKEILNEIFF